MNIIDPGHKYELLCLDGKLRQTLTFVKRNDIKDPEKFPGNKSSYPGTTLQDVMHCLCNRVRYLNNQIPCLENEVILQNLHTCIMMLEQRAAKRHGIELHIRSLEWFEFTKLCPECGHTQCNHNQV